MFFNPLATSILQSTQVQRQAADKIRRNQDLQKNSALASDKLDHQVESPDAIVEVNPDGHPRQQPGEKRKRPPENADDPVEGTDHLDLTA